MSWIGDTANPIQGESYSFRNHQDQVSLFLRIDQWKERKNQNFLEYLLYGAFSEVGLIGPGRLGAIGIGIYTNPHLKAL